MPPPLQERLLDYIRRHALMCAGDRVAVAVSGGADSTALLRLLLELRKELGIVPAVVHFNHLIRGAESDTDEGFVRALAERHELQFLAERGSATTFSAENKLSLETAARELRYRWFTHLLTHGAFQKIATAHTLDDQAETVLLKFLRGAGTRGMAGIYPKLYVEAREDQSSGGAEVVRPLLEIARAELERYLRSVGQDWREDRTNLDPKYSRNRVRHLLLPLLEHEFNPAIKRVLADTAEIARAEEDYWRTSLQQTDLTGLMAPKALAQMPLARQRRVIRAVAERNGLRLDFSQVEGVLALISAQTGTRFELPKSWVAEREREMIAFRPPKSKDAALAAGNYQYILGVPGEVGIPEIGVRLRASVISLKDTGYNREQLLDPFALGRALQVRNWRPGDRYWPVHTKSARKVKELLQERHITGLERALWPVVVNGAGDLVWMRGYPVSEQFACHDGDGVSITEVSAGSLQTLCPVGMAR